MKTYSKRLLYFFYYLKESDLKQLKSFIRYASSCTGYSRVKIISDSVNCVFIYNISLKDYFYFRFFELDKIERDKWAGTGYMYEFQLKMNPKHARVLLEDKIRFLSHFKPFVNRKFYSLDELISKPEYADKILTNSSGHLVLKASHGQIGAEVEVINCNDFTGPLLIVYMKKKKYDLAEDYVIQHSSLKQLSPSGLNTVRMFTQLDNGRVDLLGARLRISVNSPVDNMAAGNLAAPVDIKTGIVTGPGVYSDITKEDKAVHPLTGISIKDFTVPHWPEVIELAKKAALFTPENRSVGWDIAITETGVELIEGNHNWCKLLWQLPVKQGLKSELNKYL